MKVLVAVASRHGSTQEIAYAIGQTLKKQGIEAEVRNIESTDGLDLSVYSAVILGSAVYGGNWLRAAREFVDRYSEELINLPTWLFSSGPVGEPLRPAPEAQVMAAKIMPRIKARGHRVFGGKIDMRQLNLTEKAVVRAVHGAEGDFRDWQEIADWTIHISKSLGAKTSTLKVKEGVNK